MKRKIVKQGKATMTISLPAPWIHKFNLKEGDELNIEEQGNSIKISTEQAQGKRSIEISASEHGIFNKQDLSHLYILGYDEIIINFNDPEVLNQIKQRIPDCIGYEIIDQSETRITIKSISGELEEEFDNILRKVFLIQKEMAEDVYDSLKNKEFERLNQIKDLETINNKFTSFLLRLLSKRGYKKQNRSLQAYDMVQNLERIADEYKYICETMGNTKKDINKDAIDLLKQINEYFNLFYEIHYRFDAKKKIKINQIHKELDKKAKILLNREAILSHHLINLIDKIRNALGSYLALMMD